MGIEAHLRHWNSRGENVLHLASRLCNPEMFRLLIPRFQEGICEAHDQGDTALVRIIMNSPASQNWYESGRYCFCKAALIGSHSWDGPRNPLRAAVRLGDLDMCRLLICIGNMDRLSALACDAKPR